MSSLIIDHAAIRRARMMRGWSMKMASREIEMDYLTYRKVEGRVPGNPSARSLQRVLGLFGLRWDDVVLGVEGMEGEGVKVDVDDVNVDDVDDLEPIIFSERDQK